MTQSLGSLSATPPHPSLAAGDESPLMLDAHCEAGFVVGLPFASQGLYDFGSHGGLTSRVQVCGGGGGRGGE